LPNFKYKTKTFPSFLFDHLCRHSNAVFLFSQLGMMDSRPVADLLPSDSAAAALSSPPLRPAGSGGGGAEPRPFLKRGSGLSRFNLPPDPALQPSRLKRRSRSSPKLADSPDLRNPARLRLAEQPRLLIQMIDKGSGHMFSFPVHQPLVLRRLL
jgi:hypothetical protein